jgi:hypothetical protein
MEHEGAMIISPLAKEDLMPILDREAAKIEAVRRSV